MEDELSPQFNSDSRESLAPDAQRVGPLYMNADFHGEGDAKEVQDWNDRALTRYSKKGKLKPSTRGALGAVAFTGGLMLAEIGISNITGLQLIAGLATATGLSPLWATGIVMLGAMAAGIYVTKVIAQHTDTVRVEYKREDGSSGWGIIDHRQK